MRPDKPQAEAKLIDRDSRLVRNARSGSPCLTDKFVPAAGFFVAIFALSLLRIRARC
jgi:hypothetical protein